jgi:hypothetical protein
MERDFYTQYPERKGHRIVLDQTGTQSRMIDKTTGESFTIEQNFESQVFKFSPIVDLET